MKSSLLITVALSLAASVGCKKNDSSDKAGKGPPPQPTVVEKPSNAVRARELAKKLIIVDGHVDLPYRLNKSKAEDGSITEDVSATTDKGDFDYSRAAEGGLDAPFMSIYVPADFQEKGGAKAMADSLIDMVESIAKAHPDKFALAASPAEVRDNFEAGKISLPMGIENGAAIEKDLANLAHFHKRGVRYITLTHSKDNAICDSSYDEAATHKGLSAFGKKVVAEMNRLGIMIDVSHVSDDTFNQVIDIAKVPVIASHSSLRHFVSGFHRNMSDDMVKRLAKNGGVIMINFGSTFVRKDANDLRALWKTAGEAFATKNKLDDSNPEDEKKIHDFVTKQHPMIYADVKDVADHIDRVKTLVGIDHVGLGSDFDGVGDSLPTGLKDASQYPNLIAELLDRGYSETDIEKVCSGNVFRVWQAVQTYAAGQAAK